jgi:hypothetical protein
MKTILPALLLISTIICSCGYEVPKDLLPRDKKIGEEKVDVIDSSSTSTEVCETQHITWTPGDAQSILLDPLKDIFPGSVLDARSFDNGQYITIDDDKRKPVTIYITGPIFKNKAYVNDIYPKPSLVNNAMENILKDSVVGTPPTKLTINSYEVFSKDHLNLILKSKFSGGFGKVEAGFNFDDQNIKSRYILDVTQIYYESAIDNPGSKGFFKSEPAGISNYTPVYISSVKYGRRVMIALESNENIQNKAAEVAAEFSLFASKDSIGAKYINDKYFRDNSIKVLIMGGNPNNAFKIFRAVSTRDSLFSALSGDAVWSLSNLGAPLAYTVNNTSDGSVFLVAQSGDYIARKCKIKAKNEYLIDNAFLQNLCPNIYGGDDREFDGDPHFSCDIELFPQGNKVYARINAHWQEHDGNTAGDISNRVVEVGSIPDSLEILDITTPKKLIHPDQRTNGYGATPYHMDVNSSPIEGLWVIGDSRESDDMFPSECGDDVHTKIKKITFFPIRVSYTNKNERFPKAKTKK